MALLHVTEYQSMGQIAGAQMPQEPVLAAYSLLISGGNVQSPTFNVKTRFIELNAEATCSIATGLNPTANANARRMSANQTIFRGVPEGGGYQVAVTANT